MKKNVGILTWHYYNNFGSALQAFALQTAIKKLGYSSEFINYRKVKFKSSRIKTVIQYILSHISPLLKSKGERYSYKFIRFQYDYLNQSKRTYDVKKLEKYNNRYDLFLCGSDQIWAPNVYDSVYLLSFVANNKPKIAYAPSIGLNSIPENLQELYNKYLSRFDCLSVREKQGAEIIRNTFGLEAKVVLDPTFLLDKEDWESIEINPGQKDDYIFCYFLGDNEKHKEVVSKIAKQLGYRIISVSLGKADDKYSDFVDRFAGPREFIGYVRNAKYIFTDSFHGMVFSIIFNKKFYVFERFSSDDLINQNSRIYNVLEKLDLEDRLIRYNGAIDKVSPIDYKKTNSLLQIEKKKSLSYLYESITKFLKNKAE